MPDVPPYGKIWTIIYNRALRFDGNTWHSYHFEMVSRLENIWVDSAQNVWVESQEAMFRFKAGNWEEYLLEFLPMNDIIPKHPSVQTFFLQGETDSGVRILEIPSQ